MITAVCFDLFETLVTEYVADYQPSPSIAERLQIEPTQFARAWATLTPARFRGEIADFPNVLRAICLQLSHEIHEIPEALITQLHEERLKQKARPFAQVDEGILTMLTELRQRGLKLGLISNASSEEVAAWQKSALSPLFDVTIFSFRVGYIKPEAEIYRLTCEALAVEPGATLFVGDGGSDELIGAQQAELIPYWATWFLDRWPIAKQKSQNEQFARLANPLDLLAIVDEGNGKKRRWMC